MNSLIKLFFSFLFVLALFVSVNFSAEAADDPGYLKAVGGTIPPPNVYWKDSWDFFIGECTSFVAYKLNQVVPLITYRNATFTNAWGPSDNPTAVDSFDKTHWSNAQNWDDYAKGIGYAADNIPAVGAVAQWQWNETSGHVAIVTAVDTKGTVTYTDDTVTIEEYNAAGDHSYGTSTNIQAPEYIHLERPLPGGWWSRDTPGNGAYILRGATKTIYVHAEDNGNGGLQTVNITYRETKSGADGAWKVLQSFNLSGPRADLFATYTMPADVDYVLISFDIYSKDRETGSVSFQKAPNGGRQYFASEYAQGKTSLPLVSIASPLYYDYTIGQIGGSISETPVGQPPLTCVPGANQAAVFTEKNYLGNCVVKDLGEYLSPETIGLPNDSISSIKVGGGVNVRMCDNAGLNSPCEYFGADDPDLSNNFLGDNTISSIKVEDGAPTTGCMPNDNQAAFFMNENYSGTCILKGAGRYDDPAAINLPNDSISSIKVGAKARVRVCNNSGMNSPCEYFDYDDPDLSNNSIGNNTISSAEVEVRGGIALCDGTNYGGDCKWFGVGKYNMQDYVFYDVAESVKYDVNWANLYHIVLWTESNQTGNPYHSDNNVADLGTAHRNRIRSIEIYKHQPPNVTTAAPANEAVLPSLTTSINLTAAGADINRMHIWGSDYNFESVWSPSNTVQLTGLKPGKYFWQAQGQNAAGPGHWSSIAAFTINTPPVVWGGNLTLEPGVSQTIQVQASDADRNPLALSANNLPIFATFTDNHDGTAMLSLAPQAQNAGQYNITVTANDGDVTTSGVINLSVAVPQGFQAEYFNNQNLSGTPILTRTDPAINFDWGGESPDASVPADHFSARWTKTENFLAGLYEFTATGDDGIRLFIDGENMLDKWIDQPPTTYKITKDLSEGNHTIVYEYYENGWGAVAELSYQQVLDGPSSGSYAAEYYNNQTLSGSPMLTRNDSEINFDWGGGSPDPVIPIDHFSVRWSRNLDIESGDYTFTVRADDGVRLYIDDELIIDKWIDQGATTYTADRTFSAGVHVIKMEYYENGGGAVAEFGYAKNAGQIGNSDVELLSAPWQLSAQSNAVEEYQSIASNVLQGKTAMRITYNLHGLDALSGDASAIIIDQGGWRYISLSDYGQNGLDGLQTVEIPLANFPDLDLGQPVDGIIHTRFWYDNPYSVEITSIVVY